MPSGVRRRSAPACGFTPIRSCRRAAPRRPRCGRPSSARARPARSIRALNCSAARTDARVSLRHHRRVGFRARGVRARPLDQRSRRRIEPVQALAAGEPDRVSAMAAGAAAIHAAAPRYRRDAGARCRWSRTGRRFPASAIVVGVGVRRRGTAARRAAAGAPGWTMAPSMPPARAGDRARGHARPQRAARSVRVRPAGVRAADRGRRRRRSSTAIRAFPRYRMLMLTLEQIGVRLTRRSMRGGAAGAATGGARWQPRFRRAGPVPGRTGAGRADGAPATLDAAGAEALVTSLSSVALNSDGAYAGGIAAG